MPELPEVQTIVDDLDKKIKGRTIVDVWTDAPNLIREPFSQFKKEIVGRKIVGVDRRAKNILIHFDSGKLLLTHLKMTGHYLLGQWILSSKGAKPVKAAGPLMEKVNSYIHVVFSLDNGQMLALSDLRKFAKIMFGDAEEITAAAKLDRLGPEATEIDFENFKNLLRDSRKPIKKLLMDQGSIAGIGNIYSDEILFDAKIHPLSSADSLDNERRKKLYDSMKRILQEAIILRGVSVSDFRDTAGAEGAYGPKRLVYRRENQPCPGPCAGKVKRMKIGGRSAYFCPACQRL
ncbi:MAG: bifunctional DNA-formamidopyrimidine glycosylase/DNA-(apurinic or apyrimidinic site) lyase [Patescibacteria group bacterium]|nr:bifunctional DNA-formamidopyrimidine glycosylase/DNA-(apurinic or apyrimidinic site) lyase [Patescibacteria group bacterium]MCL5262175.1 bifunctional DNA-formamidopyrimidine glycosylase/DNA-(apurinic or apyrimidinic site) lyase [Patescibacteria group bacterium]